MANKSPAFNFYSGDFLNGVLFMGDADIGKYIKLMCVQHQKGHLSLEQMEVVCRGTVPKVVMDNFMQDDAGLYYNKKLEKVIAEKQEYCEKQANHLGEYRGLTRAQIAELKAKKAKEVGEPPIIESSTPAEENIPKGKSQRAVVFNPPTVLEVADYCKENNYAIDPIAFVNFYEANGWKQGMKPIKSWQACVVTWVQRDKKNTKGVNRGQHPGQIIVDGTVAAKFKTD
jgi:hypothetical protein